MAQSDAASRVLTDLPWSEVEAFVKRDPVGLVPLGAVEAHGPHLPLSTDTIIAEETARRAGRKMRAAGISSLILPTVHLAATPFADSFPGTIHQSACLTLTTILDRAAQWGVRRFAVANVHVDPAHLSDLHGTLDEARARLGVRIDFPDITRKPWALKMPEEFQRGGAHAGHFETSLVMAARPELVRHDICRMLPKVEVNLGRAIRDGAKTFAECGGAQAYFGDPASASSEAGERYFDLLSGMVSEAVQSP